MLFLGLGGRLDIDLSRRRYRTGVHREHRCDDGCHGRLEFVLERYSSLCVVDSKD